jgi:hypothetical protein
VILIALPLCDGGICLGKVNLYRYVLLSPGHNLRSTNRIDCGVESIGMGFEPVDCK